MDSEDLIQHRRPAMPVPRPRILLVSAHYPWPLGQGGAQQRLALLCAALRQVGDVEIGVVALPGMLAEGKTHPAREAQPVVVEVEAPDPEPAGPWKWLAMLPLGWISRFFRRLSVIHGHYTPVPEFAAWLNRAVTEKRYDLIVAWNLRSAAMGGVTRLKSTIPCVLDIDDIDWHASLTRTVAHDSNNQRRLLMGRFAAWETRRVALPLMKRFDRTWVCSDEDREEMDLPGMTTLVNIPFQPPGKPRLAPCGPTRPDNHELLCVGSLTWVRNIDAVDHFLVHCWQEIREQVPDATLRLAGKIAPELRSRWEAYQGVKIEGFVEDLHAAYERCAFALGLVRWGAGTKIKVIEALAYRRTCVVTPHTLRGYRHDLDHGESLLCAPTDKAMVECCVQLIKSPELRNRLAAKGHEIVSRRYSTERFNEVVLSTCSPLLERAGRL